MRKEFWKRELKSQKLNSKKMGSCEVLAGCFWLSKLEEMNGGDPLFIGTPSEENPRSEHVHVFDFSYLIFA